MRKFENGERKFKFGEVVYFICENDIIDFGTINYYAGHGVYNISLYCPRDCRRINGIPYKELDFTKEYPLPKKWSYDTDLLKQPTTMFSYSDDYKEVSECLKKFSISDSEKIKEAIKNGYLVLKTGVFGAYISTTVDRNKYKLTPSFYKESEWHREISLYEEDIFRSYEEAENYKKRKKEEEEKRRNIFATMSDEEINVYEIEKYLKERLDSSEAENVMQKIKNTNFNFPLEDLEIRIFLNEVQYLDEDRKWKCIYKLPEQPEEKHTEKYYVYVYDPGDADQTKIVGEYTNKEPEYWFNLYSDFRKYVLYICNKHWSFENGLDEPEHYTVGIKDDGSGNLIPVLIQHYKVWNGDFDIIDGKLDRFDFTVGGNFYVNNFFVRYMSKNTKKSNEDILENCLKQMKKVTGKYYDMFKEKIIEIYEKDD